jgi:NitT/TauT family transport system permease protein
MEMRKTKNNFVNFINAVYPPVLLILFLFILWQTVCEVKNIQVWMLAKPSDIFSKFVENTKDILPHIGITYTNILIGLALAIIIGLLIAVITCSFPVLGSALTPITVSLCCIPMVTLVPTLMLIFGVGRSVKLITIVIQAFPIVTMNAATGFLNADPAHIELMQSLKADKFQQFKYCLIMDALPDIFTGMKLSSIMAMMGGITAEMTGGNQGLGSRISFYIGFSKTPEALSCIIYIAFLGAVLYSIISLIEKKAVRQ